MDLGVMDMTDQNRVKTRGEWQVHDYITQDLLEWVEGRGSDQAELRDSWVCVNLVGLASSTASHESADKGGQTGPPVVTLNQVNSAEISAMASHWGAVQGAHQILSSWFRNVKMALEVQGSIQKCPVIARGMREKGGMLRHGVDSILNQWIVRREVSNSLSQPHIQGMYQNIGDSGQHGNGSVVKQGVNLIAAQECIGWTHLRTGTIVPYKVIVLHEHRPPCLLLGEILRRLEVPQVPMICYDGNRVFCASQVLAPFLKCPYDHEKFTIIDIVILLSRSESLRVIGTGVEIPVAILLYQHSIRGHERGIGHDEEREVHIRVMEDWTLEEGFLECLEGGGMVRKPLPSHVLLH